jgi:hypothetical protein
MLRAELPVQRNMIVKRDLLGFIVGCGLAGAVPLLFEGFIYPPAVCSHSFESLEISAESLVGGRAILQALEIGIQLGRRS